jgi:hypothetical protein
VGSFRNGRGVEALHTLGSFRTKTEPWELLYFKLYKNQLTVIEQALETAGLMLGSEKSRGYCLEMICADFLAGANLDGGNPKALVLSVSRLLAMLSPGGAQS